MSKLLILFAALAPGMAFAQTSIPDVIAAPEIQKTDAVEQPILPPTSTDGADALDRRIYSQFANDELHLAQEPGSSKAYAFLMHGAVVSYYDDNITLSSSNKEADFAMALEPGFAFGVGDFRDRQNNYVTADYTGRLTAYLDHSADNSYQQFATANAQLVFAKVKLNTNLQFLDLHDVDIDSGVQTSRQIYDTTQIATYNLSEKDDIEVRGQNVIRDYQMGTGSVDWKGQAVYNYRWDPKLTLGAGFAAGVLDVDDSGGQNYEQALLSANYAPTAKISIQGQGGLEMRQLGSGENRATPVFDLTCEYQPMPGAKLDVSAYSRTVSSSASTNLDYTATGVGLEASKELGISWLATIKSGYENNSYFYTNIHAGSPRDDNFFYINPSVQFRVTDYVKIECFYNYRQNASNNSGRDLTDNQVGVRASFTY